MAAMRMAYAGFSRFVVNPTDSLNGALIEPAISVSDDDIIREQEICDTASENGRQSDFNSAARFQCGWAADRARDYLENGQLAVSLKEVCRPLSGQGHPRRSNTVR